jgi:hypothetical protein
MPATCRGINNSSFLGKNGESKQQADKEWDFAHKEMKEFITHFIAYSHVMYVQLQNMYKVNWLAMHHKL